MVFYAKQRLRKRIFSSQTLAFYGKIRYNIGWIISERINLMDKKAFSSVLRFMKAKPWLIIGMIAAMLALTFGEQRLSDVLLEVELTYADYGLAVIRLILQTALSAVLVYAWHKDKNEAAPFAAVDILKLFVTTLVTTVAVTFLMVTVVLIPLGVWLYLRIDFYMNTYITGKSNGIFSCVGASYRMMKNKVGRYLVFVLKYLAFYFVIEIAVTLLTVVPVFSLSESARTALDVVDVVFTSLFMPYRFLLKCGYYDTVLTEREE